MNLYHIKLTEHQKDALEYLFSLDINWNKTELEKAWKELREHIADATQCAAIINACKPQYDPCRLFRVGDEVRFRKVNGNNARCRYNGTEIKEGRIGKIVRESGRNCFWVEFAVNHSWCIDAAYFELITPVEELETYRAFDNKKLAAWTVLKNELIFAYYPYRINDSDNIARSKEEAKAAAQAECDRLNAELEKATTPNWENSKMLNELAVLILQQFLREEQK